jgi:hypothetical protein
MYRVPVTTTVVLTVQVLPCVLCAVCVYLLVPVQTIKTPAASMYTQYTRISLKYTPPATGTGYMYKHVYDVHVFTIRCKVLQFSHLSLGSHICKHLLKRQLLLVFLFLNLHQMLIDILKERSKW